MRRLMSRLLDSSSYLTERQHRQHRQQPCRSLRTDTSILRQRRRQVDLLSFLCFLARMSEAMLWRLDLESLAREEEVFLTSTKRVESGVIQRWLRREMRVLREEDLVFIYRSSSVVWMDSAEILGSLELVEPPFQAKEQSKEQPRCMRNWFRILEESQIQQMTEKKARLPHHPRTKQKPRFILRLSRVILGSARSTSQLELDRTSTPESKKTAKLVM